MRLRILPAAAVAVVLACTPAHAGNPSEAFLQRVDQLVRWIAAHSDYSAELKAAPRFVFLTPEAIRHSFSHSSMGYSDESSNVQAAQTRGTIYLPVSFALGCDAGRERQGVCVPRHARARGLRDADDIRAGDRPRRNAERHVHADAAL